MKIIIFGASEFPHSTDFKGFQQLVNSAIALRKYFEECYEKENVYWFFNKEINPTEFYDELKKIIISDSTEELFIYYLGHGFKLNNDFYLTIRQSKDRKDVWHSIAMNYLSLLVKEHSYKKKIFFILDCCFAGDAVRYYLSPNNSIDQSIYNKYFDDSGTVIVGSASMYEEAFADDFEDGEFTLFSNQFIKIINEGIKQNVNKLTINDIYKEIKFQIKELSLKFPNRSLPEPVIHYSQRDGDCREYPLFPNLYINEFNKNHYDDQLIYKTKKIAQCQINVDLPLLYGKIFFERINRVFNTDEKQTADFYWLVNLTEDSKFKEKIIEIYIERIIKYFLPIDAYHDFIHSFKKNPDIDLYYKTNYREDKIYKSLFDIFDCIIDNNVQKIIDSYKLNCAGIEAYKLMIRRYVKKAIEAGAVVIFFPEYTFAHLSMEDDKEFMELTEGRIIIAGRIINVPESEIDIALTRNFNALKEERNKILRTSKNDIVTLDYKDNIFINGKIFNKNLSENMRMNIIQYIKWEEHYNQYIELIKNHDKPLYYKVTFIYMNKQVYCINNEIINPNERNYHIIPGIDSGQRITMLNFSGLLNIKMINSTQFIYNIFDKITNPIDMSNENIEIIEYKNKDNQLKRMQKQDNPITAAAVISYQYLEPALYFNGIFRFLFENTDIKLGLYTNMGNFFLKTAISGRHYSGQTGLYFEFTSDKDINKFMHNEDLFQFMDISCLEKNQGKNIISFHLKKNIANGMLVSSYTYESGHHILTDLQVYIPKESEYGELVPRIKWDNT